VIRADSPYAAIRALIIDDMSIQQSALRGQLASLGLAQVDAAASADDALRYLRRGGYQLILCDYNLNSRTDGQQLFEHLREQALLPEDCLFFMVTAEAQYAAVAATSEHAPDAYLLKPITVGDIEERLQVQLDKRQALAPITQALNRRDYAAALAGANAVLARKDRWFMQALQLKARVQLQLGVVDDAQALYQQALALRPELLWAQVGLMRAYKAAGRLDDCRILAEQVLASREGEKNLAAFDLLAEALDALGDTEGALGALQRAAEVVPSARRHRHVAVRAYQVGDLRTAKASFQKAWKSAQGSIASQPQDALALAQTQVELGEYVEALKLLNDAHARGTRGAAFDGISQAIKAQAWAAQGDAVQADLAAQHALSTLRQQTGEFAKLALGRAALATGKTDIGFDLFSQALKSDHEDHHVQRLVSRAMTDLGHGERTQSLIDAARQGLLDQIAQAKRLVREGQLDEAVEAMTTALRAHPDNPAMLLECAQMNCLWLRRHQTLDTARLDTVRTQLARLEKLLPGHERVARMQRYLRETMDSLQGAKPQA